MYRVHFKDLKGFEFAYLTVKTLTEAELKGELCTKGTDKTYRIEWITNG